MTVRKAPRLIDVLVCLIGIGFPVSVSRSQSQMYNIRTLAPAQAPRTNAVGQTELKGFDARWLEKHPDPPPWLSMYRLTSTTTDAGYPEAVGNTPPGLAELEASLLDEPLMAPGERGAFSLTTSIDDKESTGLKSLSARGEQWHLLRFDSVATSRPFDARLTAYGQVPYVRRADDDPALGLDDSYELALLGFTGEAAGFEVGAQYRSLGKRLDRVVSGTVARKDQEGSEIWLARRFGLVRLRLSQSELSDNVDRNPALPRTTKSQTGVTAELAMPSWPMLRLTYSAGDAERIRLGPEARSTAPDRQAFETVGGSAYYPATGWDVTASTAYTISRSVVSRQESSAGLYHDLVVSFRPIEAITVAPAISLGHERYDWSGAQGDMGSASLTLRLAPPASRWNAWTSMAYTGARTSDSSVDSGGVNVGGGLGWDLGKLLAGRSSLSVEAGYDQYQDRISSLSSSRGVFAFVLFKITGF